MAITNGYCTLAEIKEALATQRSYTAATISFAVTTNIITDTAYGLRRFQDGETIKISGSTSNDGYYTIATAGGDSANTITVTENLTTKAAGDTVTISQWTDLDNDSDLEYAIEDASRMIDSECRRHFYQATATAHYYSATDGVVEVDDLVSIDASGLVTDGNNDRTYETTWAATDYDLMPFNSINGWPYDHIMTAPNGRYSFPSGRKAIKITGTWGWTAVPDPIRRACILMAMRLHRRNLSVFGMVGGNEVEQRAIPKLDPDYARLIEPFKRRV